MDSEFIDNYSFGRIEINNETYTNDIILLGKKIIPNWWRERGHRLAKKDLEKVINFQPDILIIGTGNSGNMSVPQNLSKKLNFTIRSYPTEKAVKKYNQEIKNDKKVAGAFHLTC